MFRCSQTIGIRAQVPKRKGRTCCRCFVSGFCTWPTDPEAGGLGAPEHRVAATALGAIPALEKAPKPNPALLFVARGLVWKRGWGACSTPARRNIRLVFSASCQLNKWHLLAFPCSFDGSASAVHRVCICTTQSDCGANVNSPGKVVAATGGQLRAGNPCSPLPCHTYCAAP